MALRQHLTRSAIIGGGIAGAVIGYLAAYAADIADTAAFGPMPGKGALIPAAYTLIACVIIGGGMILYRVIIKETPYSASPSTRRRIFAAHRRQKPPIQRLTQFY